MKAILALSLAVSSMTTQAQPGREERSREILAAALARYSDLRGAGIKSQCVTAQVRPALEMERDLRLRPGQLERDYPWLRRTASEVAPVERNLRPHLNEALKTAVQSSELEPAAPIDADMLPAHLRLGGDCAATITVSAPAVVGDLAFVESSFVCGALCGSGVLLALQYRDERWSLVAELNTWIS